MKRASMGILMVFLLGAPFFSTSQAFASDDVKSAAEALAKIYKIESLANEFLFGSLAATDADSTAGAKFTHNGKKSISSGFRIKGLKRLQYKLNQNQFFDLKNETLHYVFKIQF